MLDLPFLDAYWQAILTTATIMAIAGVGLQVTIASGQFSVVHGALMGIAAYAAGAVAVDHREWPMIVSLLVGMLIAGALGAVLSLFLLRLGGLFLGIATLAIGQGLSIVAASTFPGKAQGFVGAPLNTSLPVAVLCLAVVLVVLGRLRSSRVGLMQLAGGADDAAASSLGISIVRNKIWGFAAGGAIAGLAGALNVQYLGLVTPVDLAFAQELNLLIYVILGGLATPWGPVFGAYAVISALEGLRVAQLDRYWILGLILTAVVVARPEGVLRRWPIGRGSLLLALARDGRRRLTAFGARRPSRR